MPSRRAALVIWPFSATATKYSSCPRLNDIAAPGFVILRTIQPFRLPAIRRSYAVRAKIYWTRRPRRRRLRGSPGGGPRALDCHGWVVGSHDERRDGFVPRGRAGRLDARVAVGGAERRQHLGAVGTVATNGTAVPRAKQWRRSVSLSRQSGRGGISLSVPSRPGRLDLNVRAAGQAPPGPAPSPGRRSLPQIRQGRARRSTPTSVMPAEVILMRVGTLPR